MCSLSTAKKCWPLSDLGRGHFPIHPKVKLHREFPEVVSDYLIEDTREAHAEPNKRGKFGV